MKMKIANKIILLVLVPITLICLVIGIVSANIARILITDEIELQLKVGAYSASQTLELCTTLEEKNKDIKGLYNYTGIDVTVFEGNERIASTIPNAVGTLMDSHIYAELQSGENYFATNANVNGTPYFGYYIPCFDDDGNFSGATFTGIPQTDANKTIWGIVFKIVFCILGYGLVISIFTTLIVKRLVKKISKLKDVINILMDNDLSVSHTKYPVEHDELEQLYNKSSDFSVQLNSRVANIKDISTTLQKISDELKQSSGITSSAANEIAKAVEDVAQGATSQAEETTHATQKVGNVADELNKIGINASELDDVAKAMNEVKNTAMAVLDGLKNANNEIVRDIQNMNTQVGITSESVEKIQDAVDVIKEIADQTKLLSLNANIEAARAGEAGRGFSVVASSIGELATQSANSSEVIDKILKDLNKNYTLIEDNMKNTTTNVGFQSQKIDETYDVFNSLGININNTVDRVNNINSMIETINTNIVEIVDIIANLSAISEENSASTQETMASVEQQAATIEQILDKANRVAGTANELMEEVNIFKTI